jgi:probable HAF family extracellular repeat protein
VSSTWEACQAPRGSSSTSINDTGQEVGVSIVDGVEFATEWSGGNIINLEGLPGFTSSFAEGINDAGQVVGYSVVDGFTYATEWSDGNVVNLDPNNSSSIALAINDTGQVVGQSNINGLGPPQSGMMAISLAWGSCHASSKARPPGSTTSARR